MRPYRNTLHRRPILAALVCAVVCTLAPAAAAKTRTLLFVDGPGLMRPTREEIDGILRDALESENVDVESTDNTDALIDDAHAGGLDCSQVEPSCAARLGAIAGVPEVLVAWIVKGEPNVITLSRIDVMHANVVVAGVDTFVLAGRHDGQVLKGLAERTLRPLARLELAVTPAGSRVVVDKVNVGITPLPSLSVTVGKHNVLVEHDGYVTTIRDINLSPGARSQLVVSLERSGATAVPTSTTSTTAATRPTNPTKPQETAAVVGGPIDPGAKTNADAPRGANGLVIGGSVASLVGVLGAIGCAVGMQGVESALDQPQPGGGDPKVRDDLKTTGLVWVGGLVGALAITGVGATVLVIGLTE